MSDLTSALPPRILGAFQIIPQQAPTRDFHGPWNKLLNYIFPPDSPYTVIPREYYPVVATKEQLGKSADSKDDDKAENRPQLWFMKFEVHYEGLPVLLVLLSAPTVVESVVARKIADAEARRQIASLRELCPLPTMRAVSAFGCHLCMYSCDTLAAGVVINPALPTDKGEDSSAESAPPREWWSVDFLSHEGRKAVLEDAQKIKEECKAEDEATSQ